MSEVLTIDEMIRLERAAFASGVDAWELMLDAGRQMALAIQQCVRRAGRCRVFVGKGNNGGDALVVATELRQVGWEVEVVSDFAVNARSTLCQRAWRDWEEKSSLAPAGTPRSFGESRIPLVVIDGLLGVGASGEIRSPILDRIWEINQERQHGAMVFALDLPSGLGTGEGSTVVADYTLTVGYAKAELLADEATRFVGRLAVLPLSALERPSGYLPEAAPLRATVATARTLGFLLPPRPFEQHKGESGRVVLVAGSLGTVGAAVLAGTGALRGGGGLVSLFYPPEIHPQVATMLPPEMMARPWGDLTDVLKEKIDVLAIGPGLNPGHAPEVVPLLRAALAAGIPLVLDAGALAILGNETSLRGELHSQVLLTPHPGEMERLDPRLQRNRADWASDFTKNHAATLLLKGARTLVAANGFSLSYNSTGHPGMATGGMGDTLTGVCAALIGQRLSCYDAARVGAWVCGRAAEIALQEDGQSQESLLPTDLDRCLGRAFADLRQGVY